MGTFKAVVVEKAEGGQSVGIKDFDENDLMEADVTVRVTHSTLNYKDGLALTGPGDMVVLNGWGTGETHLGAYGEKSRVKGDWLVPWPEGLTAAQAMAIGTAGYTAMLALLAIERHGVRPDDGPAMVTGAAGGVGSVAIALLAKAGWHVIASTGRAQESDYLKALGAAEIVDRSELSGAAKLLAKERWAAGIDAVGSTTLANLLAMTKYRGAIAACGLAGGMDLPTSVAPFILRGVSLLGIDSVMAPKPLRLEAWRRLARDLDPQKLAAMTTTISLDNVVETGRAILEGKIRGRVVVEVG